MSTTPSPTGRRQERDGTSYVVLTRTFRAPIEDVWAAVTEPGRLERWIGTWTGDPASGQVAFRMTAEGEDAPEEIQHIDVCEPPRRLVTRFRSDGRVWQLELDLTEADGATTLTFAQVMSDPDLAENVGPGWEFYLDRLVAVMSGAAADTVVFDDYYPAMSDHYRTEFTDEDLAT
jgi:uncharacterized protein YndB with AHSA1/START domain